MQKALRIMQLHKTTEICINVVLIRQLQFPALLAFRRGLKKMKLTMENCIRLLCEAEAPLYPVLMDLDASISQDISF